MKNRNNLRLNNLRLRAVLLFVALGLQAAAFGQITPSQDAYTNTGTPTTEYGTKPVLNVESGSQITYIQFDLSSIPPGYSGANVAKASLKFYVDSVTTAGSFNVDFVNGSWSEKTITANLSPALGNNVVSGIPLTTGEVHHYILVDITSALVAWLDGSQTNDGIALVGNSPLNASFDSKENTGNSQTAELDVVFTSGGTITGVDTAAGSGLAGGGGGGTLNLSLVKTCATNQILRWTGSAWTCASVGTGTITGVKAGADLTGGGNGGNITLNLDTTKVPLLGASNTFTQPNTFASETAFLGPQLIEGNVLIAANANGPLVVQGTSSSASGIQTITKNFNTSGGSYAVFNAQAGNGAVQTQFYADGNGTGPLGTPGGYFGTYTNHPMGLFTNNTQRVWIKSTGEMGVGTYPLNQFEVFAGSVAVDAIHAYGASAQSGSGSDGSYGVYALAGAGDSSTATTQGGHGVYAFGGDGPTGGNGVVGTGGNSTVVNGVDSDGVGGFFIGGSGVNGGGVGVAGIGGSNGAGFAGDFTGSVVVTGDFFVGGQKNFEIDHPLDPANKYLVHSAIESSEMMNLYTGNVTTGSQGEATVHLSEWFEALNTDFRYQLTVIGVFAQAIVAREIQSGQFTIRTSVPNVKVSWQVTGVRQDAYAKVHPLVVEQEKEARLRGFYIHPELFGAPGEKQLAWGRHPEMMKRLKERREQHPAVTKVGQLQNRHDVK